MKERDRLVATSLLVLLLLVWLGFLVHRAPRFAGSAWGGLLGVVGAALMLVPLLYSAIKRIPPLKRVVTRRVRMRTWLAIHIYAGLLGPILVLLHTGHKFESPLGVALTAMTLVVVVSGFVGRYLMGGLSKELREKRAQLQGLEQEFDAISSRLQSRPEEQRAIQRWGPVRRLIARALLQEDELGSPEVAALQVLQVAESISDLEHSVRTHEQIKRAFGTWLKFHIALSVVLYLLLALHVWAGIHFGLRWFS